MKTPLQILYELVFEKPAPSSPQEIQKPLKGRLPGAWGRKRGREVVQYLLQASTGHLGRNGSGGSLKYVIWWLRDHTGELYEYASRAAIRAALDGSWPLSNALPNLKYVEVVEHYVDAMEKGGGAWQDLAQNLEIVQVGQWKVAINLTAKNLTSIAGRSGVDIYIARSQTGAAVKAFKNKLRMPASLAGWVQPYPDLIVCKQPEPTTVEHLLDLLPEMIEEE